jgi:hypothetical protein
MLIILHSAKYVVKEKTVKVWRRLGDSGCIRGILIRLCRARAFGCGAGVGSADTATTIKLSMAS